MSNESEGGAPSMESCDECRDDAETRRAPAAVFDRSEQESRGAVASHAGGNDEDEEAEGDMNITRLDDEESNLDINSVISGMEEDEEGNIIGEQDQIEVFGKNLSSCFDSVGRIASSTSQRPPLPPTRDVAIPTNKPSAAAVPQVVPGAGDKRLSVFLRVRPPVCSNGTKGNEGAANTIEIIETKSAANQRGYAPTLPTTVRTYPPLNSNAAKVVRCGGKVPTAASSCNSKKAPSSKSLIDDGRADNDSTEVRGVKEYSYSGVFGPKSTQSEVYNNIAAPLVDGLFPRDMDSESLGESALLFTLGVTNAGKTHTVMGTGFETKGGKKSTDYPSENWGIIPRALHHILTRIDGNNGAAATNAGGPKLQMYMSYLEIYNESIYDLLPQKTQNAASRRPCDGPPTLKLRESRRGRIFVRDLARHAVSSVQQGLELAQMAKTNRHTASNNINSQSSRSHSICQLEISLVPTAQKSSDADFSEYETDDESVCSRSSAGRRKSMQRKSTIIWIVDLAGSERSKKTRSHSSRQQKEAAIINASLMNLMRCLREMLNHQPKKKGSSSKAGVIPFRESKLTHMFMNHLTGPSASRTCMIVNVNPASDDYDETQHVLGYATTARSVTISAVDYNRKRRILAKESRVKLSPKKALVGVVKKLSPKKRKGGAQQIESMPHANKRMRSHNHTSTSGSSTKFGGLLNKPRPKTSHQVTQVDADAQEELERLREENFKLKITVEDLGQQLVDCEAEVRGEVVNMMDEQLQETKQWYESRIDSLKEQITSMQSSPGKSQRNEVDLLERIEECENEMQRMGEDHKDELSKMALAQRRLVQQHESELRAERQRGERLQQDLGASRHQYTELKASHDNILANLESMKARQETEDAAAKENPDEPSSTSSFAFKNLPRERVSAVASTSSIIDVTSPKKKRGWFKSPGKGKKIGLAEPDDGERSPLGKINTK